MLSVKSLFSETEKLKRTQSSTSLTPELGAHMYQTHTRSGNVVPICKPSTQEAKIGLRVLGQPRLHSET